ncbi:hypothetical protein AVEN_143705-1 [Araneus ventricosus]|uniref:Secreted protein n=1 Tax=Araneus ventricosus TaxID=182803 RepID=A0A4Y2ANF1_ARAVE|nr:hypothetical protein AVEN_143705-1 [Araneus ventricosus]
MLWVGYCIFLGYLGACLANNIEHQCNVFCTGITGARLLPQDLAGLKICSQCETYDKFTLGRRNGLETILRQWPHTVKICHCYTPISHTSEDGNTCEVSILLPMKQG